MECIEIKEVSKQFGRNSVLRDVNLSIHDGDIVGIIGQSGSGKTTLLNLISGFLEPSSGKINLFSKADHKPKSLQKYFGRWKRFIGFTPQHTAVYPKLTVKENLLHFGQLYGLKKKTIVANAKNLLTFTGLYKHRDKLAEQLSGGMKKRLDISCSLIHKPKVLFLDEPTANLDPIMENDVVSLIREVNKQGVTIVIASHHLESIEDLCNKIAIIRGGEVHSFGEIEDVRKPFLKDNVTVNIKFGKERERVLEIARGLPVSKITDQGDLFSLESTNMRRVMDDLLTKVNEEHLQLHVIDVRKPTLKEIFHKIAKEKEE